MTKGPFLPLYSYNPPPPTLMGLKPQSAGMKGGEEARWRNGEVNHSPLQRWEPEASSRVEGDKF